MLGWKHGWGLVLRDLWMILLVLLLIVLCVGGVLGLGLFLK